MPTKPPRRIDYLCCPACGQESYCKACDICQCCSPPFACSIHCITGIKPIEFKHLKFGNVFIFENAFWLRNRALPEETFYHRQAVNLVTGETRTFFKYEWVYRKRHSLEGMAFKDEDQDASYEDDGLFVQYDEN